MRNYRTVWFVRGRTSGSGRYIDTDTDIDIWGVYLRIMRLYERLGIAGGDDLNLAVEQSHFDFLISPNYVFY